SCVRSGRRAPSRCSRTAAVPTSSAAKASAGGWSARRDRGGWWESGGATALSRATTTTSSSPTAASIAAIGMTGGGSSMASTTDYVELRCRSAFSFLAGASLPEDLVEHAAALGYDALALADRGGVYGAPRFFQAARRAGLRALVGAEVAVAGAGERLARRLADLAAAHRVPVVATNDVRHAAPEGRPLLDVLTCIRLGTTLDQAGRRLLANTERHLKPPAEMAALFRDMPDAIRQSRRIAERCA